MKKLLLLVLIFIASNAYSFTMSNPTGGNFVLPNTTNKQIKDRAFEVKNAGYDTLEQFSIVMISGADGNQMKVAKVSNYQYGNKTQGILLDSIKRNSTGMLMISGVVKGCDTSKYSLNDELWLDKEFGKFTNIKPVAKHVISLGTVIKVDEDDGWFIFNILKR